MTKKKKKKKVSFHKIGEGNEDFRLLHITDSLKELFLTAHDLIEQVVELRARSEDLTPKCITDDWLDTTKERCQILSKKARQLYTNMFSMVTETITEERRLEEKAKAMKEKRND